MVEGIFSPTVQIKNKWREQQDRIVVSAATEATAATAATSLLALAPAETKVLDTTQAVEEARLCLVS